MSPKGSLSIPEIILILAVLNFLFIIISGIIRKKRMKKKNKKILFVSKSMHKEKDAYELLRLQNLDYSVYWCYLDFGVFKKFVDEFEYDIVIIMSSVGVEDFVIFLFKKKIKFIIASENMEDAVMRELNILDFPKYEKFFHYIVKPFAIRDMMKLIRQIFRK